MTIGRSTGAQTKPAARQRTAPCDISVLLPSRRRPEKLLRCVTSLGSHPNVEIIVGLDNDDATHPDAARALRERFGIEAIVGPRAKTLGALVNDLAARSAGKYLFFLGDDNVIGSPDWPARILRAADRLPRKYGVLYPRCMFHPGFATLPIISRATYRTLGYYMAPFFPFWFIDTWWDEIGDLMGAKIEVDLDALQIEGKGETHGLVDLAFWAEVFAATRPLRAKDAMTLARYAYGRQQAQAMLDSLPYRLSLCAQKTAHLTTPDFIAYWERHADQPPSPRYLEAKAEAETMLRRLQTDTAAPD
jgi:hypothetical protein